MVSRRAKKARTKRLERAVERYDEARKEGLGKGEEKIHERVRTPGSWIEHRDELGKQRDAYRAMQLVMAATKHQPLAPQEQLYYAMPPEGLDRVDKFFCGGVGAGKSSGGMHELAKAILLNPGVRSLVVAPTYDQALHVLLPTFLRICEQMEAAGYPILKRFRWSQMRAELICGGEVFFRSVSKIDNLLGFEFAIIHFDECETIANPELVWRTLSGRLRQQANFRQFVCTSTPRGLRGVLGIFHEAREDFETPDQRELLRKKFVFVRATTFDNPHLPPDYIENLRRTLSKAMWDQEVLAKILRPEAAVYSEFERERHEFKWRGTREALIQRLRRLGVEYDIAYDPGQTYAHVLFIARFVGCDVVFDELCEDDVTTDRLHAQILERCAALGRPPSMVVLDRAVKRERAWALNAFPTATVGWMERRSEQSIAEGIAVVKNLLDPVIGEPKLKFATPLWESIPRRGIVTCMREYAYAKTPSGMLSALPYKDNKTDHGADAERMWAMKRHGEAYRMAVVQRRYG